MDPSRVREWNALDTHDGLTDWYKHRRSEREITAALEGVGLRVVHCSTGENGVVARAVLPES